MVAASTPGRLLVGFTFLCFQATHHLIDSYTETYWQSPLQVFEYKSFRSVRILEFTIPLQTSHAVWVFTGLISEDGCEERNIEVALQHGSYPIVTPHNETFPSDFNTHRTALNLVHMLTNGTHTYFSLTNPLPGSMYAAMYLVGKTSHRFKQKGLSKDCKYFLSCVQEVNVVEQIPELTVGVAKTVEFFTNSNKQYRFKSTDLTWQYRLNITNCNFTAIAFDNGTGIEPVCPILVAVRGMALAGWNSGGTRLNCSESWDGENCSLTITAPYANAWQFIEVSFGTLGYIQYTMHIEISECNRYGSRSIMDGNMNILPRMVRNVSSTETPANSSQTPPVVTESNSTPLLAPMSIVSDSTVTLFNLTPGANLLTGNGRQGSPVVNLSAESTGLSARFLQLEPASMEEVGQTRFDSCTRIPALGRYQRSAFDVQYSLRLGSIPFPNQLLIPCDRPLVLAFEVKPLQDNGGTLKYQLDLLPHFIKRDEYSKVEVVSCIQRGRIPMGEDGVHCDPKNQLIVNTDNTTSQRIYFPYPESGTWYISLITRCYNMKCADICRNVTLRYELRLTPCIDGGCGLYGRCHQRYFPLLSICQCHAYWRGYGCTDDTVAESDSLQLAGTLLLSLSNLAFIPAILVALHRRFYVEALVYSYTMFFSTFYHACDGDSRHIWCMMPYNVLAHCDFFGAILSFWVTLIAMARLPESTRSFLLVFATLALAMGVQWDRHNLWTFLVPAATGLGVMLSSWSYRCYRRKECYPTRRRWLLYILPGMLIAISGLLTFAFFETTRNYKYTHSIWHACMALCIVFILPPRRVDPDKDVPLTLHDDERSVHAACCSLWKRRDRVAGELIGVHRHTGAKNGYELHKPPTLTPQSDSILAL